MNRRPLSLALCLLAPFVILASGLGMAGVEGYRHFRKLIVEDGRGTVPPGFVVDVVEPGKHTLWLHTYVIHEGTAYESGPRLPDGARVVLISEETNSEVSLMPWLAASKSFGSEAAKSIATFDVQKPGRYSVIGTGFSRPVVLSIAPAKLGRVFGAILQVCGIAILSLLIALVVLIVLLHRRQRALKAEVALHTGPQPDAFRSDRG